MQKIFKQIPLGLLAFTCVLLTSFSQQTDIDLKEGDILFQTSGSSQSKAIQLATNSAYSHCGLVINNNNKLYVLEAVEPVKFTPIEEFIKRGEHNKFVVKRLKDRKLQQLEIDKMRSLAKAYAGKHYDIYFEWSDSKMYCSELVWKIYKESTGLGIGKLRPLKSYNIHHPLVVYKLKERYGSDIPYDQNMISPGSIYNSELLKTVYDM